MKIGPTRFYITAGYGTRGDNFGDLGEHPTTLDRATDEVINWLDSRCSKFRVIRVDFDHETDAPESVSDVTEDVMDAVTEWYQRHDDDAYVPAMNDRDAHYPADPMGEAADRDFDRHYDQWVAE